MFKLRLSNNADFEKKFQGYIFVFRNYLEDIFKLDTFKFKDNVVKYSGTYKGYDVKGDIDSKRIHVYISKNGKKSWTDIGIRGNETSFKPAEALKDIITSELDNLIKEKF